MVKYSIQHLALLDLKPVLDLIGDSKKGGEKNGNSNNSSS